MPRALRRDEIRYLERHRAGLTATLRGLALTAGLLALPLAFLASTLSGRGGWGAERWSALGAGLVMLLLIGGVVYYGAREQPLQRFGRADWRLFRGLARDLDAGEAESRRLSVGAKEKQPGRPARYWLLMDGFKFQVGAERYMATAVGQELLVEWAPHSGLVLALDETPERVAPSLEQRGAEATDPWGAEEADA